MWKILPSKLEKRFSNTAVTFITLLISLVIWFLAAFLVTWLETVVSGIGVHIWLFSLVIMLICMVVGFMLCWGLPPTPKGTKRVKWYIHLLRGFAAMFCIFVSNWLSSSGLGLFAGAFSGFPAIFSTSIVSVSLEQGASVSTGAVGPMIIGGCAFGLRRCVNCRGGWFALICGALHLYTQWPVLASIIAADVVTIVIWNIPIYFFVTWRRDVPLCVSLDE